MSNQHTGYKQLVKSYPILTDQMNKKRLEVILRHLTNVLESAIAGDVAEFGCYSGTTSLFIRRLMDMEQNSGRTFHVYDSFNGLPQKTIKDASVAGSEYVAGELKASKRQLIKHFKQAGLKPPAIHKGWFNKLTSKDVPGQIVFAFLDCDFYNSIYDCLTLVWPNTVIGGEVVIDDFNKSNLPGVTRAITDYFAGTDISVRHECDLAIIKKT